MTDRDTSIVTQVSAKIASDLAVATYNKTQSAPITDLFRVMFETVTPLLLEATGVENVHRAFPGAEVVTGGVIGAPGTTYPTGQYQPEPTKAPLVVGPQNIPGVEDGDPETVALWNEYFSDPSQFWDNRTKKASGEFNSKGPDFSHKTKLQPGSTYKLGLWINGRDNPSWVRARLNSAA